MSNETASDGEVFVAPDPVVVTTKDGGGPNPMPNKQPIEEAGASPPLLNLETRPPTVAETGSDEEGDA